MIENPETVDFVYDNAYKRLSSSLLLPIGWHYGEGIPPDKNTFERAKLVLDLFKNKNFKSVEVFPLIEGHILISSYIRDGDIVVKVIDVTIHSDGLMSLHYNDNDISEYFMESDEIVLKELLNF